MFLASQFFYYCKPNLSRSICFYGSPFCFSYVQTGKILVSDVLGKVVMTTEMNLSAGNNLKLIDFNLASGLYSVQVVTQKHSVTEKLIIK
jgi:hypothetical protein